MLYILYYIIYSLYIIDLDKLTVRDTLVLYIILLG